MVEHAAVNRRVEGSSPSSGAISILREECLDVFGGNGEVEGLRISQYHHWVAECHYVHRY